MKDVKYLLSVTIAHEIDVVTCRQSAKQVAAQFGLSRLEQIRIATAVSELARNIFQYVGAGEFRFALHRNAQGLLDALTFEAIDQGSGIADLERILAGNYVSPTGMGLGLRGAQRLMDEFDIQTSAQGTRVLASKRIQPPRPMPDAAQLHALRQTLSPDGFADPFIELKEQGAELLLTTSELHNKQQELAATNVELENTNKGVVALYSELEKTAHELKEVSESKSRFFSSMTHEFRTPINIIDNISKLLLAGSDGSLNPEQFKQVNFISDAAVELSELVNELLDLAEAQSGRMQIVAEPFSLQEFMYQVRQFITALASGYPHLHWEMNTLDVDVQLDTDRNRLFQILRNLITNAFKYTPAGHVKVHVFRPDVNRVEFMVEDTGIGIAADSHDQVFEEFARIRTPGLKQIQGTGLGLPLAQKLAGLLRGHILLQSEPGQGSRFFLQLPCEYEQSAEPLETMDLSDVTVLIIDDNPADRYLINRVLHPYGAVIIEADNALTSIDKLHTVRPDIVFLDLELPDINGEDLLESMDWSLHSRVIVNTAKQLSDTERAKLASRCHVVLDKSSPSYAEHIVHAVQRLTEGYRHAN